ncbi:Acetyltransferase (GNAT) domain-containing protein [Micromonospora pattaloongensis]|uniref:Acetyltransferase (GNAT) domain-containing protein n=1 Tax=Micromonospora pattaloongensis TaxID=405436 RepID=A0A1H3J9U7_9ACTN|nr:GNAT family N-acetyltransferase [Micromonospora pattaloongensis]SDY36335.1 Acetyltransferase (GNAT) domain-containing protein [Micromonospora pattaloongensis]
MQNLELTGPDLLLRPWRDTDAPAVLRALRDAEIAQWNPGPVTVEPDLDTARTWVERRADWSAGDHASLAVTDPATGAVLGSVSLHSVSPALGNESIGYRNAG